MEARENGFKFVRDEKRLTIPFFQRAYVWKKEHWEQFFNDLKESFESKKEHFLGSVIIKRQQGQDNFSMVIDGQQRLTTFSILIKVLYNSLEPSNQNYFKDYLFETYTDNEPKIYHSKFDREKYIKILQDSSAIDPKEDEGIFGCFNYFKSRVESFDNNKTFSFMQYIIDSKLWVVVCLNANEDEQKIFDSINSTGEKLTATDIIKNALFDKAIKETDQEQATNWYEKYWESTFESKENREFWNAEIPTGRIKRVRSEIFLHAFAIIKGLFDPDKHSLEKLSSLYKDYIRTIDKKETKKELENLLSCIQKLANIYFNFPKIDKDTMFIFDEYEKRFFHIVDTFEIHSVLPLVIYLKDTLQKDEQTYRQCLYMLEILILCNSHKKNYNKFFARIIKESQKENGGLQEFLKNEIKKSKAYLSCLQIDYVKEWLYDINNHSARLILFWIELYRRHKEKEYKDIIELQYVYTLEHLMPSDWDEHWKNIGVDDEKAEGLIYQIGNMTLVKGQLNSALQNLDWQSKLNGISKNADLLITKELLNKKEWDENKIKKRTKQFIKDFIEIWDITIFNQQH
ncbi:DUF262 domain-containing protein [Helicobacter sp. 10-6591]|uniref:DUF262 domain-containing protein n=1 Tax=Helicobacter sp. 10-6591 TaxID=2004998 RepID=UPI000DCED779|nr:DUF262 domain-containing protein [Helicobacter sp. 10-6591]RAX56336.1 hypothetical protein CCY97_00590 [Helicobacter sp. 10-6591]